MTTLPDVPNQAVTQPAVPPPDVDALFPSKSVDELFPASVERDRYRRQTLGTSPIQDLIFGDTTVNPIARVLDAFGQGAKQAWGAEPNGLSQKSVDELKKAGVFNDYDKGQRNIIKAANESLFRGAATYLVEPIMRGLPAAFGGVQATVAQIGEEAGQPKVGREAAAMFEAFPTGFRAATGVPGAGVAQMGRAQHIGALEAEIAKARDLGVIGAGEAGYHGTQTQLSIRGTDYSEAMHRPVEALTPEPIAPKIEAKPGGMPVDLFETPREARPVEASVDASVDAAAKAPEPWLPATEAGPPSEIALKAQEDFASFGMRQNQALDRSRAIEQNFGKDAAAEYLAEYDRLVARAVEARRAASVERTGPKPIAEDVTAKLVAAGRPEAEARASAELIASHYEARAERFNGQRGTAEEMYAADAPDIRSGEGVAPARSEIKPGEGGAAEPVTTVPELKQALRGRAGADPQTWSLYEFLAKEGGLEPTADLKSIFGGKNPFVPGFGPLLRKGGLTMDEALTRAKENAYILDPNDIQHVPGSANLGENTVSVNHLHDLIGNESRGQKNYRIGHAPEAKVDPAKEAHDILTELHSSIERDTGAAQQIDPAIENRVVEIVRKEGGDVHDAFERAIMEDHDRYEASLNDRRSTYGPIEGHDFDSGAASRIGEEAEGNRGPARATAEETRQADEFASRDYGEADRATAEFDLNQIKRGKISVRKDAKPIITLFKDANASTFVHETGHAWLEELMADSEHPKAPAELKTDAIRVLDWLGVESADKIKTSHHEKFARGFERYMMEGKAPSQGLANVFEKFKNWLTRIYQTVNRLKSPINDEIRGVFDRLLTMHPSEVKIEPEGPPKTFADIHEADALHTAPEAAHPVAETIQAERDMLANEHIPEEHDARLEGIAAEASRREAGGPQPLRDGNEAARPEEAGNNQASGAVSEGGSVAPTESARPSASPRTEAPVSPQEAFKPASTPLVDKAGNIRLENVNAPEDVLQVLRDSAERNNGFIDERRGVVSDAQAMSLADAMGMDAKYLDTKRIGDAWNKEEIFALERMLIQSATAVRDAMASGDVLAYADAKARLLMIHDTVQGKASAARAEAGRALQAFAALKKMKGSSEAHNIANFLKDNSDNKTLFQLEREMKLGAQLDTPAKVSKFVNESIKPTWTDMTIELWMSFLLSGPKTHVANVLGNTISGITRPLETAMTAGVGKLRNLVTGAEDRVLIGEAKAELFGMVQGAREGVVAAYQAFKTEEPQLTPVSQTERGHQKALPSFTVNVFGREMQIGGKQLRIPLRMLGAEDEFFKSVSFRGDINRQAHAIAAKEGLAGEQFNGRVAELSMGPTEEMIAKAKAVAEYQTFQTPLGKVGRAVQNFSNAHPLAKIIIPFVRTPINLLKYAGERTPLGLFSEGVRDNLAGKNGSVARDTQIARIALGTIVGVAAFEMAHQGLITGGGPGDKNKKALMQEDGWQDYSVRVGDMYYRYNRLDPFSVILGVAADAYEISNAMGDDHPDRAKIPAMAFAAISQNVLNRASLQGISDAIQAVSDHDRYGQNYIKKMAGTIIPAFSAQSAQAIDPVVRETRTVFDNLKARLPFVSENLHPKRTVWGEPKTREGGLGPDVASPIVESRVKNDPVNKALIEANYFPGHLSRKIHGIELTDQQYDDFARVAGRTAKMRLNAIVSQPGFSQWPEAARKEVMQKTITSARDMARDLTIMQSINTENDIMKKAMAAKRAKQTGEPVH